MGALMGESGCGWVPDVLRVGGVARLTYQKGFALLLSAVPRIVGLGCWLGLLGAGDPALELGFGRLADAFPGRVSVRIGYDEPLAHRIYAGADAMLVPSRFEPDRKSTRLNSSH